MRRLLHELARLHAAELRKRAVRRLIAPDTLRRRQQRVATVAVLVVAVVLIAVNDDFVADLPAIHFRAHGPNYAGGVGAGNVEWMLMSVERGNRHAEPGPHAVIVDAGGHDVNQRFVFADRPRRQHLLLHGFFRRPVALLADGPGVHLWRHVPKWWNLADVVKVLKRRG